MDTSSVYSEAAMYAEIAAAKAAREGKSNASKKAEAADEKAKGAKSPRVNAVRSASRKKVVRKPLSPAPQPPTVRGGSRGEASAGAKQVVVVRSIKEI
jgi:hypothetical protein